MIYKCVAFASLALGADAFSAGALPSRQSAVARSASAQMQVAEAEVASPVALAKVRRSQGASHSWMRA